MLFTEYYSVIRDPAWMQNLGRGLHVCLYVRGGL